jgi:hypothetical protein
MYIQYFWRKLFSGWGFTTSPFGVRGGGSRNSGLRENGYMKIEGEIIKTHKGGLSVLLSKTVVFKCCTVLEKFITEVAGRIFFFDLVWGQEPW